MDLSIILATYNEGDRLAKTIESCIETCGDLHYEILVADDASTDGSVDEVERRFSQIRLFRHERRLGTGPTKALGAHNARGEVMIIADAHSRFEHGAISRLVEDVKELGGTAIVT